MKEKLGFIGLGNMGLEMARNLIAAGYHLQVYNRTADKANELDASSITRCSSPAEAAQNVQVVISMLSDDDTVTKITIGENGILKTLAKGCIHISMSTISPAAAKALAEAHEKAGNHYLAAPVFGRPEAAAAKKLWICVSGREEDKEMAKPILECMGQGVIDFGNDAGANIVKVIGNFMIFTSVEMMAEALKLAEAQGLDRAQVANFFGSTVFNAPIYQNYGKLIAEHRYEPVRFKATLGHKDLSLAHQLAKDSGISLPMGDVAMDKLRVAIENGLGERDCVEAFDRGAE